MNMTSKQNQTALVVIDVQQGLFERSTPIYQARQVLANINSLISRARQAGVPVIFIQHSNSDTLVMDSAAWQFHPEIRPLADEKVIHKIHGNAFEATDLQDALEEGKVKKLVITGLVTHGCVKATCLGALDLGYTVILVRDGHSNFSKDAPELIEKWNQAIHKKGAELKRTEEVNFSE